MTVLRIALDWTPNTIHSGLYIAKSNNLYSEAGLDVQLLPPDPSYSQSPAKRLEAGEVDLAVCPSESVIAYAESAKPGISLQAIYAILQKDASAIVTKKDLFARMRDLESGTYGSYNARYEDNIVRAMISADGGDGEKLTIESSKSKLSLFEELKQGNIDATWIFLPWEGVEAQMEGFVLNVFQTEDFGVPYGYSPIITRNAAHATIDDDTMVKFVAATKKGYEIAMQDPMAAVEALKGHVEDKSEEFLLTSQREINKFYSDGSELGDMKAEKWQSWIDWLKDKKLVTKSDLQVEQLATSQGMVSPKR